MMRTLLLAIAPLMLVACSPTSAVVRQASFDFRCPSDEIQVVELNPHSYQATGCQQLASYNAGCSVFGCQALTAGTTAAVARQKQ
jgi:hypothetical protein